MVGGFSGNFAYAPPDVRVGLGTPTALRGHIVGLIQALKPRYVPGIHGPKGAALHYLMNIEHFLFHVNESLCVRGTNTRSCLKWNFIFAHDI